jgi:hypothetical protein
MRPPQGLDVAPVDKAVIGFDAQEYIRPDPEGAQAGDAQGGGPVGHLRRRAAVGSGGLVLGLYWP